MPPVNISRKLWIGTSIGVLTTTLLFLYNVSLPTIKFEHSQDRSKTDGEWMSFQIPYKLYAYSAFWDDRESLQSLPVVRIIAVSESLDKQQLYCKFLYKDHNNTDITAAYHLPTDVGVRLQGYYLRSYVITCPLVERNVPYRVSLIPSRTSSVSFTLPICAPEKPQIKQDFIVCVSVAYWKHDLYRIIEWMELLRLFGVSKVTVYNNSLSDEASRVFKHYDITGFVDFRQSHNFFIYPSEANIHLHMSPVINDCMYRNMHSYKKVVVTDLDEIITPQKHTTYKEMLQAIDKQQPNYHPARNYIFLNAYFFTDDVFNADVMQNTSSKLYTIKYRQRLPPSPPGYSVKSIIDPQACTNMHNHQCWGLTPLYQRLGEHVEVLPDLGLNQHYKKCHFDYLEHRGRCAEVAEKAILDNTMLRFEKVLTERVNAKLNEIGLQH